MSGSFAQAQIVRGTITEQATGLPVRGVGVLLRDLAARPRMAALSDSLGRYSMTAPQSGSYVLNFSRAGLNALDGVAVALSAGSEKVVDATLTRSVTKLATVDVVGESVVERPAGNPHKYDEFHRRRALGMGTFLTREQIHSRPRHQMQELFNGIPGIKVRHNGTAWKLQSQRCSGRSIPGLDVAALAGATSGPDPKYNPMLFIDGVKVQDITAISELSPSQVEAIEVYQGAAQLPSEARGDACFAIFVWLRNS
jgi:hypothetical protein